ncbi:MBL fold metallo-hydrolase RNA specificity domain-containing protein [Allorhodopirellula heiligendammensis]|uniref:Ribonuclease n=1 Tax=Allorhodopirellula heiligendammensis TaxID=2714739 RepID=A0A5C6C200_9BACT|nr:MBL fold metallo-hydrolase [Allorhodopirellula heiligendammensis]TWU18115.1 Ribonuclease [Allorhodopirellula heiligendammensis]
MLVHHGAHDGVTGSCHQLFWNDKKSSLLVDCGIFQGSDAKKHPNPEVKFPLRGIECLLLTHVHIDHVGRLPYLMAAGFDQPIFCSVPTAKLLPMVMEDALRIGFTRSKRLIEKFTRQIGRLLKPIPYHQWHDLPGRAKVRLLPAGHVLGSAIFEVELPDGKRVVFSGDLGAGTNPLLNPPESPERADLLVLESTYGDRLHPAKNDRQEELEQIIRHTLADGGVTIIPAFSLGRTQALLYELNGIFERVQKTEHHTLMKRVDVIVDSPLASRFTAIYKDMQDHWGEEAQVVLQTDDQPLVFENLTTVGSHTEHRQVLDMVEERDLPAVVIAGSGMCTGGRVVNYLKRFIGDGRTDIVFAGYQAGGTPGHYISRGSDWVRLDGRKFDIAAKVHQLSGYSAHGDQADLIRFVDDMETPPGEIRLVHGEYGPKRTLAAELTKRGYSVV